LEKYLVVTTLTVMESDQNKALENAGGELVLAGLKGEGQGIPYHAMLDANGRVLATSRRPTPENAEGSNIGHPMAPEEVAWFMEMLKKGAPKMTDAERKSIEDWLKAQK
jgi:hypothetical protein